MVPPPSSKRCSTNMPKPRGSTAAAPACLAEAILERARETGLAADCGIGPDQEPADALRRLDAWLCDVKEARIGDGLHVFGKGPLLPVRESVEAQRLLPLREKVARSAG